jgi:hypothetical protein
MDDRRAQFLIAVGELCTAAGLAALEVQVRPGGEDGETACGIPRPLGSRDAGEPPAGATGYPRTLAVGDRIVNLEDIEACTIYAPDHHPRS